MAAELVDASTGGLNQRDHRRGVAAGIAVGILIAAWVGTAGSFALLRWEPISDFYDAQAAAWLDGRWDIGVDTLGVESFFRFDTETAALVEGGWPLDPDPLVADELLRSQPAYMYQGPVPAIFRLPSALLAPGLSGRLTLLSILVGTAVAGWSTGSLLWEVRRRLRASAPVTRGQVLAVGAFVALVTGGSSLVYLAAKPWVYHEALVWGAALCIAALAALMRYLASPTTPRLVAVGALVVACLLTRASVGLGPLAGLAGVAVAQCAALVRDRWPTPRWGAAGRGLDRLGRIAPLPGGDPAARAHAVGAAGAVALALLAYATVNFIKFRTLFSVPFETQLHTLVDLPRQEFLEVNGGFFSLDFVPTTLVQYLRPDAFRLSSLAPWIEFAPAPGRVLAGARFDLFDRTASITSAMPLLAILAVVGLVAALRGVFGPRRLGPLLVPLLAAAASGLTVLPFGYIANRYVADFLPVLVLSAAIGLQAVFTTGPGHRRARRRVAVVGLVAAGLFGAALNISHGILMQRVYGLTTDEVRTASFLAAQDALAERLWGGDLSSRVDQGDVLPAGSPGDLFVIGACDAMYLHDGNEPNSLRPHSWIPVERTEAGGRHEMAIRFGDIPPGASAPIFSGATDGSWALLVAEATTSGDVVFSYSGAGLPRRSAPVDIEPGHTYAAVLITDPHLATSSLWLDGRRVFEGYYAFGGPIALGRDVVGVVGVGGAPTLDVEIERRPGTAASLCERLVERAG